MLKGIRFSFRRFWRNRVKQPLVNKSNLLAIVILVIVFKMTPWPIPNILGIHGPEAAINILTIIASVSGSILGIVVAISLVAFGLQQKVYVSYATMEFFQGNNLKRLFFLYIATIIVSLIAIGGIDDVLYLDYFNLTYLSIFLFIASITFLYPFTKSILSGATSKHKISDIANRIDYGSIQELSYTQSLGLANVPISVLENNPIFRLTEIATRAISHEDRLLSEFVIEAVAKRLMDLVESRRGDPQGIRDTLNAFLIFFKKSSSKAINTGQEFIIGKVLQLYGQVYEKSAKEQIPYHAFIEWDRSLDFIVHDCITNDLNDAAIRGLWTIERAFEWNFDYNMPQEDDIWEFRYDKYGDKGAGPPGEDSDNALQWSYVSTDFITAIGRLCEWSIKAKNETVARTCLYCLTTMIDKVIDSDCGELQKDRIILWGEYYRKDNIEKGMNLDQDGVETYLQSYRVHQYNRYIEKRPAYANIYLGNYADLLIKAAEINRLDYLTLNEMGTIARSSIHDVDKSDTHANAVIFICDQFDKIGSIIEKNKFQEGDVIYTQLFKQVQSFDIWMKKDKQKNTKVQNKIDASIKYFAAGIKQLN